MPAAFEPRGDFRNIADVPIAVDAVHHKGFVLVNEEGTEAAAATGVVVALDSVPPAPKVFRADHPFVFVIRDGTTGSILFMGRVASPKNPV